MFRGRVLFLKISKVKVRHRFRGRPLLLMFWKNLPARVNKVVTYARFQFHNEKQEGENMVLCCNYCRAVIKI